MSALKLVFLVVIFMVSETLSVKYFRSIAGPFKVNLMRMEKCPLQDEGSQSMEYFYQLRRRRGEPTVYSMNATLPFMVDDTLVLKGNFASWSNNGGWKPNAYIATIKTPCTMAYERLKPQVEYIMKVFFGEKLSCPFYAGLYRAANYTIPGHLLTSSREFVSQFMYGRWRLDIRVYTKDSDEVGCVKVYFETLPM